jgi:predicted GH43/DUF377 family glycosyl hydrolase
MSNSVLVANYVDTVKILFNNVPTGDWNVTVTAKDSAAVIRFTGTAIVTIAEDQVAQLTVQMVGTGSGVGGVQITIVWPIIPALWKMADQNPVISQSPSGWDASYIYVFHPCVLHVDSLYRMWSVTANSPYTSGRRDGYVCYATSIDGIHWSKTGIVINPGPSGSWYEGGINNVSVLYDDGKYKMWFDGYTNDMYFTGIGYAESQDGLTWSVQSNRAIVPSASEPGVYGPNVLRKNAIYYLYYSVEPGTGSSVVDQISLRTSTDGTQWQEQGVVLRGRQNVWWEGTRIHDPFVLYDQNHFVMYYTSFATVNGSSTTFVGKAISADGIVWSQVGSDQSLSAEETSPWTTSMVAYPCIIKDGGKLKMWFSGWSTSSNQWRIGYAEQ